MGTGYESSKDTLYKDKSIVSVKERRDQAPQWFEGVKDGFCIGMHRMER